ncbi:MAG: hypothetical protein O7C62_06885 [Rickettsia endosymbiont of Ixodes persulcatus]|nr:hypothetical protein [Rickettsia endosymbiont of Ixodes persulcatus]
MVFYIFFLLDAQWSFRAYVISLINSFYFCILNIPAILLAYIPAVIAIWSINILFTMLPVHTITAISKYVAILTVLVFYTAGLSSLYIKRRFDQFEYYYV